MNNYRTSCSNRRMMPGSAPSMQSMKNSCSPKNENLQTNSCCRNAPSSCQNSCECKEITCNQADSCECPEMQHNNCCVCTEIQNNQNCGCDSDTSACRPEPTLNEFPIGMAYVPIQQWRRLYDKCAAFRHGTLFQELNLDFLGRRCN